MLLVAMRRPPRGSWTGRVLVLADEPSPAAQRAGRRNRAAGEGNPSWVAAGPRAAMLEATGKDQRQAPRSLWVADQLRATRPRPDRGTPRRPGVRSRISEVIRAQIRDRVPDSAAVARKVRESSGTRRRDGRSRFRCKLTTFARGGLAAENRG